MRVGRDDLPPDEPANLLEVNALTPAAGARHEGGEAELRTYFQAVDRVAEARQAIRGAYRDGRRADRADNAMDAEFDNASTDLQRLIAQRTSLLVARRVAREAAGRPGGELSDEEVEQITHQVQLEQISNGIVSVVRREAELAPEPVQRRANILVRALAPVLGNRVVRGLIYTAAGAGIILGIASGALPAMAIAGGIGGAVSVGVRRLTRHIQGRRQADAIRQQRNSRPGVEASNNETLLSIGMPEAGESYDEFLDRAFDAMYDANATVRDQNRTDREEMAAEMRQVGWRQTARDFGRGALLSASISGFIHLDPTLIGNTLHGDFSHILPHHGAAETIAGPVGPEGQIPADVQAQIAAAIKSGNMDQLQTIVGDKYQLMSLDNLTGHLGAHSQFAGDNMANIMAHQGLTGSNMDALQQGIDAINTAHTQGLGISSTHVDLAHGFYNQVNVTDPHLFVVTPDPAASGQALIVPIAQTTVQGGNQAALAFTLTHGGQIVSADNLQALLQQTFADRTADVATQAQAAATGINLPLDIASGIAGGTLAALMRQSQLRQQRIREGQPTTPQEYAEAAMEDTWAERGQYMEPYLQQPRTQEFVDSLPPTRQMAFARMVHDMTGIPRADVAAMLALDARIENALRAEDDDDE